ncbi:hypothetical protein [Telmatospirillum sp. J64-1]|uniref:hypothetical protein n=1 Tax=Telmatospirillum sp. J64-1 TaxID=2502183 RepID=UPI00115D02AC|nr:hypothetical protein [Telmatospirillum sp. J64-1]
MQGHWSLDLMWWITAVELPALAGLFWMNWRGRQDQDKAMEETRRFAESGLNKTREALAAYKLEVAQSYPSMAYLKDVERRLTEHLVRIESKLDAAGAGGRA